jgi:glycosyl transferase family 25
VGRIKGTGAYVVSRTAAKQFVDHLLPIKLPYDHALDREWFWGLNAVCALPFPISQTDRLFRSSIQKHSQPKLSRARRFATTYPYQAFNEVSRYIFRLGSLVTWEGETGPSLAKRVKGIA